MTFSKTFPAGVAAGAVLTHSALQDIDQKTFQALDKSGDTVTSGTIAFGASQTITHAGLLSVSGTLATTGIVGFNAGTAAQWAVGTTLTGSGTSWAFTNSAIALSGASYITLANSAIDAGPGATINLSVGATLNVASTSVIAVAAGGFLQMAGTVVPTFVTTRTYNRVVPLGGVVVRPDLSSLYAAWTTGIKSLTAGPATALRFFLPHWLPDSVILNSVDLRFTPVGGHAGLPVGNIQLNIYYYTTAAGASFPAPSLIGAATYSPVSLADYNNGQVKSLVSTPSAGLFSDTREYMFEIIDESGTNCLLGNIFHSLVLTFGTSSMVVL